ncbi:ABC transporter ATP-binding protein [Clostridium felsineum]|uniref:ABC transporter ATP-binding protein n=1 Tax=Clostridium felsineum TaxID=36839 RepID=UPI00098BDEC3|nr:ABC transporter ATP-binding protein [Clostridium felsineum]URZ18165.1 Lipid A export ATP-binding/permease protein MsbA [Clostridium felsineum DSM 794]
MSEKNERKKAKIGETILTCLKLVVKGTNIKEISMANIWLISGGLVSIVAIFEKNFYNAAAQLIKNPSKKNFDMGIKWLCIWAFIMIIVTIINFISTHSKIRITEAMNHFIQYSLMEKVSRIELSYFDDIETHNKFNWVKDELSEKISLIVTSSFGLISFVIQFIVAALVIISNNYLIAIILLVGCIPSIVLSAMQTEENYKNEQNNSHELRYQTYVSWVMFKRPYMKEMRFGNLYNYIRDKFEKSVTKLDEKRKYIIKKYTFITGAARLVSYIALGIGLVMVSYDIYMRKVSIGSFMLVYSSSKNMQASFEGIFLNLITIANDGRFIEDYADIMKYKEEDIGDKESLELAYKNKDNLNFDIEFKNVTFKYPGTSRVILNNISLKIKSGEKISIVGENGCGKSTFIALICGLYKPDKGHIYIGGIEVKSNIGLLRQYISCAFQDFGHYEMSIADNIRIGDLENEYNDDEIRNVLKLTDAYGFVSKLNEEINTPLGFQRFGGTEISGGQWQKLAMARVLIKKNSKILILDEPTAALDPMSESQLYSDFNKLTGDKTVLLISHRLGATRLADRILVFKDGEVAEEGTHNELIRLNGLYSEMYHVQSQWYVV